MEDSYLFEGIREGNRQYYKTLFLKYYSPLCEYGSQFVSDENSEEIVQDLMLFIWENRAKLLITTSVKSYLFMSIRNRCLNAIRKQQYHERVHINLLDKLKEEMEDPDYYLVNELAQLIEKAISELPDSYKETFVLSRFGEKSNEEIAQQLGVSKKTVEYRMTQALKLLRKKLKDYLPLLAIYLC